MPNPGNWLHIPTKQQRGQAVNLYRGDYSAVTIKKVLQHRGNYQLAIDKNMVDHIILLIEEKQDIIVERGLCYRGNTLWIHEEEKNTLPRGRHLICLCNVEDTPLREDMTWTDVICLRLKYEERAYKKLISPRTLPDREDPEKRGCLEMIKKKDD